MFRIAIFSVALLSIVASEIAVSASVPARTIASASASPVFFQGTVAIVTDAHLVLATRTDRKTFIVPSDALIIVNRAEGTLHDIMPGHFATVSGNGANGQFVAKFVDANRQY